MEENRKKHGWASVAILLAVFAVAYPLSTGPAIMMVGASGCNRTFLSIFRCVYTPLEFVPESESLLRPWAELWDIYGVFRGGC